MIPTARYLTPGGDSATSVSDDCGPKDSAFTRRVRWVQIDLEEDNVSHLEPEELKYHRALARQ
jgi:hypothetical protein